MTDARCCHSCDLYPQAKPKQQSTAVIILTKTYPIQSTHFTVKILKLSIKRKAICVQMGSPDYPGEENNSFQLPLGQSLPMHGIHNSDDEADSDDSMPVEFQQQNNPDDPYHAYQPLSFEPAAAADDDSSSGDDDSDDENNAEVVSVHVDIFNNPICIFDH